MITPCPFAPARALLALALLTAPLMAETVPDRKGAVLNDRATQRIPSNLIYPFPAPEPIGIECARDHAARIKSVKPGSAADQAGFRAGDDVQSIDG